MNDPHLAVLLEMLAELRHIRAALKAGRSDSDYELLRKLLPAIGGRFGSDPWTTRELLQEPAIRALTEGMSPHKLGTLFARSLDVVLDGLRLERLSVEHSARLWRVVRVSTLPDSLPLLPVLRR